MINRHHELQINEVVYDWNMQLWGRVLSINGKSTTLGMRDQLDENKNMFDLDCEMDNEEWEAETDALYQLVEDLVDKRTGNRVCYEHYPTQDGYPYYSPYLDENLFEFECMAQ